jgi:hypothetical protein
MDYQKFYSEVVDWINQCNQMAMKHGMNSNEFWNWVTSTTGEIGSRYQNNELVIRQMVMLYEWLEDLYAKGLTK